MDTQIEQVITELSKIDAAAENILEQVEKEKEEYAHGMNQKTAGFDKSLEDDIHKELSSYEAKLLKENNVYLDKLQKDTDAKIKKLEEAYSKFHTTWAREILQSLITKQEDL